MDLVKPQFDKHIPIPAKGKKEYLCSTRAYVVGQEDFAIGYALSCMEVGDSCLISNWAAPSISYAQNKYGYKFQRQLQEDGSVRVWRTE